MHPSKVCNFRRNCFQLQFARTSPSTFLFLQSSQCQRADLTPLPAETSWKPSFRIPPGKQNLSSGCPADRLPCQRTLNSGSNALGVVNVAGCSRDVFVCQHPIFVFQQNRNSKTRNQILICFQWFASCPPPFGAALFSDERVIGAASGAVNTPMRKS